MKKGNFQDRVNNQKVQPQSDLKDSSLKNEKRNWDKLYKAVNVESMPWYLPELDPDVRNALYEYRLTSGTFLDLGTGPGTQANELSKMGFTVTGSDISAEAVKNAQKLNENIRFLQDDILKSKMNKQFDYILDRGCFHTIDEDKRFIYLAQIEKLLNKEGLLFLKCFSDKNTYTGGPHHFSRSLINSIFSQRFDILKIIDSVYQNISDQQNKSLFIILRKID